MGTSIRQTDQDVFIPAENRDAIREEILALHEERDSYAYVGSATERTIQSALDGFSHWRYEPVVDDEQNIVGLDFRGEKLGDDKKLFNRLAEYIADESYIEFTTREGQPFRYFVTGDTVEYQEGSTTY